MAKSSFLGATALRSAAAFGLAITSFSPALAQDAPVEDTPTTAETASEGEAVVITGSRIRRDAFNSPDPISIINPEIAIKEGKSDLASMLQSSPIAAGSTQITSAISSNFVTNGGPGAQTIDLRGLGANRTLVLLNGRRAGPAGTRGGVSSFDLNVLPQSIVQNIEILKTGASSVYGSDAVAGVVNIITKTDTNGIELNLNTSVPFDGGGESYRLSAVWGKTFERGHILVAGDYTHVNELSRGQREYLACPEAYTFRPGGGRADLVDPRTGKYMCEDLRWGHVWTYNPTFARDPNTGAITNPGNLQLDGPGGPNTGVNPSYGGQTVLMQYQYPGERLGIPGYGAPAFAGDFGTPAGWFPVGYDRASLAVQNAYHPFVEQQSLIPRTDLYTAYANAAYEVTDSVELFGEFLFNRRETYQNGWRQFWQFGYTGDMFGTGAVDNFWAPGWTGLNLLSPTGITDLSDNSQKVDYYRGVAGVRGDIGGSWKFEIYGQYSKSIGRYRSQQILQDVYDTGYFQTSSCVGTVTPVSGKQCMDLPWADPYFLAGQMTAAQANFLTSWEEGKTVYEQITGEASVSGDLFTLPAGSVGVAAGISWRRDQINDVPGEITRAGNAWGASTSGITAGHSVTSEAFAEINVPILADVPFFHRLTFSAAGRITNVTAERTNPIVGGVNKDSDNGNWTYKLGLNWAVTDWVRFRGSYGTSYRAPALFEQFLADETSFPTQRAIDPCRSWGTELAAGRISQRIATNCAADGIPSTHPASGVSATSISRGGLGLLSAETSRAFVVGGILTPKFDFLGNTRVSLAVDYFDIRVKGQIAQLGAANILFGCYDSANFASEPLCNLFTRGQSGAPNNVATVTNQFINISEQQNRGVDVAFQVRQDLGSWGTVSFFADMTWQTRDDVRLLPTSPVVSDNGEAGSPRWVGDFRLNWVTPGNWSIFYGLNVIGGTSNERDFLARNGGNPCIDTNVTGQPETRGIYCPDLTAPAVFYHNLSLTKELNKSFDITLGVSNLFDTRPPRVSYLNGSQITMLGPVIAASQYSLLGRRAFLNVRAKF